MFRQRTGISLFVFTLVATAHAQAPPAMHGTWVITSAEGRDLPPGTHAAMVITPEGYQGFTAGKLDERGTVKVDVNAKPMTLDLTITEGASAGKVQLGVVELSGDTMRVALAEPGRETRPASVGEQGFTITKLKPLAAGLAGRWESTITVGERTQRVVLSLNNGADGLATGTVGAADQTSTLPITAVVQMGGTVRVIIAPARATFEGKLEEGELRGTWMQGPLTVPAVFRKS